MALGGRLFDGESLGHGVFLSPCRAGGANTQHLAPRGRPVRRARDGSV